MLDIKSAFPSFYPPNQHRFTLVIKIIPTKAKTLLTETNYFLIAF